MNAVFAAVLPRGHRPSFGEVTLDLGVFEGQLWILAQGVAEAEVSLELLPVGATPRPTRASSSSSMMGAQPLVHLGAAPAWSWRWAAQVAARRHFVPSPKTFQINPSPWN
jgi:hypothetical protein